MTAKTPQHQLLCYVTVDLYELVRRQAFDEHVSVSAWVQRAVRAELEREQVTP